MSQRECAGFNWPPLAVTAGDPLGVGPETKATVLRLLSVLPAALFPFCAGVPAIGVAQPANQATRPNKAFVGTACSWPSFQSRAAAVGQLANCVHPVGDAMRAVIAKPISFPVASRLSIAGGVASSLSLSPRIGVGHDANRAASLIVNCCLVPDGRVFAPGTALILPPSPLLLSGVGHPVEPLSDVRCPDARSAQITRPCGVARCFHVSLNKIPPDEGIRARNLLSNDDWRTALVDEVVPCGPQMPLVIKPSTFACRGERLARTAASPNSLIISPTSPTKRKRPDSDSSKEVALGEASQVSGPDIHNAAPVNDSGGDVSCSDEVLDPVGSVGFDLVVVGMR